MTTSEISGNRPRKVLVTGADGFIGSHLVELLVREGHDVRAFVLYNSFGSWGWLDHVPAPVRDSVEVFMGDIRDGFGVRKAVEGCEVVFHLAALIGIPYSYESPDAYVATNVQGTLNLLQAARDAGVDRFIHTSTSEVYGTAQEVPIDESHPLHAQSPYAATKIAADQLALSFFASFELPVVVLRPFNTYGPRQSARAVIPTIITQIATGSREVRLGSLHPTRDFSFVGDTANAFLAAANAGCPVVGKVINVASGFEVSIEETIGLVAEIMSVDVEAIADAERIRPEKSEVERLFGDASRARNLMGWAPEYGGRRGFTRGLRETVRWFSDVENLGRYRPGVYVV